MEAHMLAAGPCDEGWRVLDVTASTEPGLPGLVQRGMPGLDLVQRAERIWAAVTASGLSWPASKVTVTVTPDALPVHDSTVDLATAVAVLAASATVDADAAAGVMYYAGLAADGSLQPLPGALPAAVKAAKADCRAIVVAADNAGEASPVKGLQVVGASRLAEVVSWLRGGPAPGAGRPPVEVPAADLLDEEHIDRALLTWVTEPGEELAGALIRSAGPARALDMIRSGDLTAITCLPEPTERPGWSPGRALGRMRDRLGQVPSRDEVRRTLDGSCRLVCPGDREWPDGLDRLGNAAPVALWVTGAADLRFACGRSVAVTGSRAATAYGCLPRRRDQQFPGRPGTGRSRWRVVRYRGRRPPGRTRQ